MGVAVALLGGSASFAQATQAEEPTEARVIETVVETESIPYEVVYVFSREMGPGRVKKMRNGHDGTITRTFEVVSMNGVEVERNLVKTERADKVDAVFHMGRAGFTPSRGAGAGDNFTRAKVIEMESTAYTPDAGRGARATFRTATGRRAEFGVVAVDPKVIPLGTLVFVEGYGFAIAADTGGAIKGNKIDVCIHSRAEALQWGRRNVRVHVFEQKHED